MTTRFLDDRALGSAITEIVAGTNARCAVAFWGTGAVERLFGTDGLPGEAKVVCDLSLGSTNPHELRAMGAPGNRRLKHVERLHAKLYLSDRGAIICSANASDNGIGFVGLAGLLEAGVFISPDTDAYAHARGWFDRIWRRARAVDEPALDQATTAWSNRSRSRRPRLLLSGGAPSLLATVAAHPERYRGIGFVFTSGRATRGQLEEAAGMLAQQDDRRPQKLLSRDERRRLRRWPLGDLFTQWSEQDLDAWPRRFVSIHRPRSRASYWFYERAHAVLVDDDTGAVFAERSGGLRAELGFEHGCEAMMATDAALVDRLFAYCEQEGHWLCENGEGLLRLIEQVEAG